LFWVKGGDISKFRKGDPVFHYMHKRTAYGCRRILNAIKLAIKLFGQKFQHSCKYDISTHIWKNWNHWGKFKQPASNLGISGVNSNSLHQIWAN